MSNKQKYRDHDIHIDDISSYDRDLIKSNAIRDFVETKESGQVPLIINSFMGYLKSKGFRIVKKEETDKE